MGRKTPSRSITRASTNPHNSIEADHVHCCASRDIGSASGRATLASSYRGDCHLAEEWQIIGVASVIDGYTIEIHRERIRLFRMDTTGKSLGMRAGRRRALTMRSAGC